MKRQFSSQEVTQLLHMWCRGEASALDKLVPLVHDELHRRAHRYMMRENAGHMLQTTALINEVYLHLINGPKMNWQDRAHFFGISARLMRQILVDYARSQKSRKRGGKFRKVPLNEASLFASRPDAKLAELDDALTALAKMDPRKALVVELRFFGGLSLEETAEVLKVSTDTVWRDWDFAKGWLYRELKDAAREPR